MSHSWEYEKTKFIGNSDLSGNITIVDVATNQIIGEVYGQDIIDFIAGHVCREKISKLEEMTSEEILGLKKKKKISTFEDLIILDSAMVKSLLRNVAADVLVMALKGASPAMKKLFFDNMSERAEEMVLSSMEALGPVRLRDVDRDQNIILIAARELILQKAVHYNDDEDELVY